MLGTCFYTKKKMSENQIDEYLNVCVSVYDMQKTSLQIVAKKSKNFSEKTEIFSAFAVYFH